MTHIAVGASASVEKDTAGPHGPRPHRIVVVGSGPRGLSVVERLSARLVAEPAPVPVEITLIDAVQVGCGRIWRTDQPEWYLMNTVADEVSAYSGPSDGGPARPGAGPSLAEWWQSVDPAYPGPNSYAPRALHGRYMLSVLDACEAALPAHVRLVKVHDSVEALERPGDVFHLRLHSGRTLTADRVVLVTGHARPEPQGVGAELAEFAAGHPHLTYIGGDSAADMPLDALPAGASVGVLGLGLSFYDVMAALTTGRGGSFVTDAGHGLRYLPSGREPRILAGSRSGMPLPARGRNQKHFNHRYRHVVFTVERVRRERPQGPLDFVADVLPWLQAEIDLVHHATALRQAGATAAEAAFVAEVAAAAETGLPSVRDIAARHPSGTPCGVNLDELARPFEGRRFASPQDFEAALLAAVDEDLRHAEVGNIDSPLKAALDVLRDSRAVIRELVDFGGLSPASHRDDFIGWYNARSAFLAAGPPRIRLRQVKALIAAGVLRIVGPHTRFGTDREHARFTVDSPQVAGSAELLDAVIDARVPNPDVRTDPAPLTRDLLRRGTWSSYVNGAGPDAFDTGGVAVTRSPYHPVGRDGEPLPGLYVLGIPTEHTRWFMQGGSSRPGFWTDFVRDADAIAADALAPATGAATGARPQEPAQHLPLSV